MAEPIGTVDFRTLVAQATALLLTRGVEVEPVGVQGVTELLVRKTALRTGLDEDEAVHLVAPEVVADLVVQAAGPDADSAHSVRPVRVDDSRVSVSVEHLGHLAMAAAQAGKYASTNGAGPATSHLLDLVTEIGATLVQRHSGGAADLPVGVLDELAHLVDAVADRVESGDSSICPCGEDHGQADVDAGTLPVMRRHAEMARGLREEAAE